MGKSVVVRGGERERGRRRRAGGRGDGGGRRGRGQSLKSLLRARGRRCTAALLLHVPLLARGIEKQPVFSAPGGFYGTAPSGSNALHDSGELQGQSFIHIAH